MIAKNSFNNKRYSSEEIENILRSDNQIEYTFVGSNFKEILRKIIIQKVMFLGTLCVVLCFSTMTLIKRVTIHNEREIISSYVSLVLSSGDYTPGVYSGLYDSSFDRERREEGDEELQSVSP